MISLTSTLAKTSILWIETGKNAASSSWIIKILVAILAYLEPIKNMYHFVAAVIGVNLLLGFYKNWKINKESWDGKKAWKTIEKVVIFTVYCTFIYTFEKQILCTTELYVTRFICGILILSEAKSISENGDAILNTRIFVPFFKKLTNIFERKQS